MVNINIMTHFPEVILCCAIILVFLLDIIWYGSLFTIQCVASCKDNSLFTIHLSQFTNPIQ